MELKLLEKNLFDEVECYFDIIDGNFTYINSTDEQRLVDLEYNENRYSTSTNLFKNEYHKNEIIESIQSYIKSLFSELYNKSKIENYFWQYCSFRTYQNTYEIRKNKFLDIYDDLNLTENDFHLSEIHSINFFKNNSISKIIDLATLEKMKQEFEKKISFIKSQSKNLTIEDLNNNFSIFTSKKAEKLFERYFESYIKDNPNKLVESSFIYRKMYSWKQIHHSIRGEMFKNFISTPPYDTVINSSLKTYDQCKSQERESNFQIIYELVFKE